jgi:hypothetical protein
MARANSARARASLGAFAAGVLLAATPLAACHRAPANPWVPVPSPRFAGRAFGDTTALRASVVAMDTVRDVVVYTLSAPAHLVMLDVSPGVSIEQLYPAVGARTRLQDAGEHMATTMDSSLVVEQSEAVRDEYQRCIERAADAARGKRGFMRPPLVRDSSGKVTPASAEAQRSYDNAEVGPSQADLGACRTRASAPRPVRKPVRNGEHYLVVLATGQPVTGVEVAERLKTLAVVGSDVATTIEAIGAGLFVGRPGSWSGYYVSR